MSSSMSTRPSMHAELVIRYFLPTFSRRLGWVELPRYVYISCVYDIDWLD